MKTRKTAKRLGLVAVLLLGLSSLANQTVDVYQLTVYLKVPQVVDNSQSLGKREYQRQKITGNLLIYYDNDTSAASAIQLESLVNDTFKVAGQKVRYKAVEDAYIGIPQIWNAIGSNKTGIFGKSSICFNAELEPSYALTQANSDNSLMLVFAGTSALVNKKLSRGQKYKFLKSVTGIVVGTQGCGCHDYGHRSPTRVLGLYGPTDQAVDIAAVRGTWKATFKHRTSR